MGFKKVLRKQIESWACLGRYGYGDGAAERVLGAVSRSSVACDLERGVCAWRLQCVKAALKAASERWPEAGRENDAVEELALDNGLGEFSAAQILRVRLFDKFGGRFLIGEPPRQQIATHGERLYFENWRMGKLGVEPSVRAQLKEEKGA